ncbi:MarR family transcriptional regulator [Bacillus sp. B15-48]|uniref:MarR family winged helix-turn-helix transcriptional regulator n=1 Tax=Bacillus sp. B15-48 TaxID=1548601 RepID=UPI00193EDCE1|nr:MarR family transcriptional regulator [Bacillus sp. B15-48]MBM4763591.1 MarR family transcriptional regulator [Bacillus sp. B15-48]
MEKRCRKESYLLLMKTSKDIQERIKQELVKDKLNITEFSVLEVLYLKGIQTINQIGDSILISSSSMTYVIDKLEKRGLLKRSACPDDRRAIHVNLTDLGKELMEDIMPRHEQFIHQIFESISHDEEETVIKLLNKLRKKINS